MLFSSVASMSTTQLTCPRCHANRTKKIGQSSDAPATSILRCEACGHVWMPDSPSGPLPATPACSKCGSVRTRLVGCSAAGVGYFRCAECQHLIIEAPKTKEAGIRLTRTNQPR